MKLARGRRVYLLDAHDVFRLGVLSVLTRDDHFQVVGEAASITHGLREILDLEPDVLLVGMRPSERAELEEVRQVRQAAPSIRVLVLARADQDADLAAALRMGATGYLDADVSAERLLEAVGAVASGRDVLDQNRAMRVLGQERSTAKQPNPLLTLTAQERRILDMISEGLTNRQIAERLFLVEKTVRNHVTRLLAKLGVASRTQAALLASRLATPR